MNRLIIIGNGFDLAHGLQTSYSHFFNYLLESIVEFDYKDGYNSSLKVKGYSEDVHHKKILLRNERHESDRWICAVLDEINKKYNLQTRDIKESIFFKTLFKNYKQNSQWSNLESLYFKLVKDNFTNEKAIILINEEFEHLKNLLEKYLFIEVESKVVKGKYLQPENLPLYSLFDNRVKDLEFEKTVIATFNYTSALLSDYYKCLSTLSSKEAFPIWPIYIHGKLNFDNNPIIFGYGDENSDEYKSLEANESNHNLKYFKTFQYLRTDNYTKLLSWVQTNSKLYIQIIGHSCGLTDKALLRSIFQHESIVNIEYHYHERSDNYFENAFNISRLFDDNTNLRDKLISLEQTRKIN